MEAPVVLAGLGLTEPGVERPGEVAIGVERPKKVVMGEEGPREAAMVGAKGPASLSLHAFLSLPAFLSSSTSLTSRRAFFLAFDKRF